MKSSIKLKFILYYKYFNDIFVKKKIIFDCFVKIIRLSILKY